jgi:hypothetical protein
MDVTSIRRVRPRGRRIAVMAGAAALTVLAASGCAPRQAGAAAIIGNQRITEASLQASVRATNAELAKVGTPAGAVAQDELSRDVLTLEITKAIYAKAGSYLGITVTPGEVSTAQANAAAQNGGLDGLYAQLVQNNSSDSGQPSLILPPSALQDYIYMALMEQKLQAASRTDQQAVADAVNKAIANVRVKVNPRYGQFSETSGSVVAYTPHWLRSATS